MEELKGNENGEVNGSREVLRVKVLGSLRGWAALAPARWRPRGAAAVRGGAMPPYPHRQRDGPWWDRTGTAPLRRAAAAEASRKERHRPEPCPIWRAHAARWSTGTRPTLPRRRAAPPGAPRSLGKTSGSKLGRFPYPLEGKFNIIRFIKGN